MRTFLPIKQQFRQMTTFNDITRKNTNQIATNERSLTSNVRYERTQKDKATALTKRPPNENVEPPGSIC